MTPAEFQAGVLALSRAVLEAEKALPIAHQALTAQHERIEELEGIVDDQNTRLEASKAAHHDCAGQLRIALGERDSWQSLSHTHQAAFDESEASLVQAQERVTKLTAQLSGARESGRQLDIVVDDLRGQCNSAQRELRDLAEQLRVALGEKALIQANLDIERRERKEVSIERDSAREMGGIYRQEIDKLEATNIWHAATLAEIRSALDRN